MGRFVPGDTIMTCLANRSENILLQLAAASAGVQVATIKDAAGIDKLESINSKGFVTSLGEYLRSGKAAPANILIPPILTGTDNVSGNFLRFQELFPGTSESGKLPTLPALDAVSPAEDFAFYNSTKGLCQDSLLASGEAAAAALNIDADDKLCLPITLNHSFGMGSVRLGFIACIVHMAS
eukprot:SAG31_NODE_5389_length_2569_cov_3.196761_1_plen_181_part_00